MSDNKHEVGIVNYSDVVWCNSEHMLLGMNIHLSDDSVVPYAYRVDGSEDNDGFICQAVRHDYISGNFRNIQECPAWKLQVEKDMLSSDIRAERDRLISETDYLTNNDYPISEEDRELIRVYRQALRDVPQQEGFPESVIWPEKPSCIK